MRFLLLLLSAIIVIYFTAIYKPFISIHQVYNNIPPKFFYISKSTLSRMLPIEEIDPSYIYLPNLFSASYTSDFAITNNDHSSLMHPPQLYFNETFFLNNIFDRNTSLFHDNRFNFPYNRRPYSTFGTLKQNHISQNITHNLEFSVSPLTDTIPILLDQMPSDFSTYFEGKTSEPAELFFHIYNNFIFGTPTISKTTGSEELDSMISSYLKSFVSSMSLPDGYYRFALPP